MTNALSAEMQAFSKLIDMVVRLDEVPHEGREYAFAGDSEVTDFLVEHSNVTAVANFAGKIKLRAMRGGYEAHGKLQAKVTQECVVTLDPVDDELSVDLERVYLRGEEPEPEVTSNGEVFVDLEASADNEWFEGDTIDLADLIFEQFQLALNPYPRKEGAEFPDAMDAADEKEPSPFAVLAKLKQSE